MMHGVLFHVGKYQERIFHRFGEISIVDESCLGLQQLDLTLYLILAVDRKSRVTIKVFPFENFNVIL